MEYLKHIIYKKYLHANSKYGSIILSIGLMNTSCAKIRLQGWNFPGVFLLWQRGKYTHLCKCILER